ncbi:MAG: DHA2 family efflux MFS transporter permease subunit [Pseudomonadota bacterium]
MLGVGLGVFMATVDVSIVNVSMPTLVVKLHTDFASIQWVILSYVLVVTSVMLGAARLGDMLGKKKLYIFGLALFTFSSLLCGLAPSVGWLIGFRGLQGCGAVLIQALGAAIIAEIFPSRERGRAMGVIGAIVSLGLAFGPPLGGLLIGLAGWRFIFLVNVPIGLLAFVVVGKFIPEPFPPRPGQRFDAVGAVILFLTLLCYASALTLGQRWGFRHPVFPGLLAAFGVGLTVFIAVESRRAQPMVSLKLFRNTLFSLNLIMAWLVFIVIGGMFILPFYLDLVKGYPAEKLGLLMMVVPVCMGSVSPWAGSLSDRFGSRRISLLGLLTITLACFSISTLHEGVTPWGYVLRMAPLGIGLGLFQAPNNSAVMGAAPRDQLGVASGLLALSRTMGHTTGLPLFGALYTYLVLAAAGLPPGTDVAAAPAQALVQGVNQVYRLAALVILLSTALAAAALYLDMKGRKKEAADGD